MCAEEIDPTGAILSDEAVFHPGGCIKLQNNWSA